MGVEPPFIYDKPTTYCFAGPTERSFNPKAATIASWQPPAPRPKRDGPLINFNRHPDSASLQTLGMSSANGSQYLIVPYGNLNVTAMKPNTKAKVRNARTIQLVLRLGALLGALGSLFCVIAINNTASTVGWIIRLAPAVAILHTVYAVYHLCRSATGRTAASTASYMLFAATIDTGLIPFFVFAALMSHGDYTQNLYGWSTLFSTSQTSYTIIFTFFILTTVESGLFLVSLVLGIYLAILFRKIAKLPPDMNPLEPNLTARPHHKRNKSELASNEKHLSGSTVTAEPILGTRRVPFMHTRTDSADSVTLYTKSARQSKVGLTDGHRDVYNSPPSMARNMDPISRPLSTLSTSSNHRDTTTANHKPGNPSKLADRPTSWLSYIDYGDVPRPLSTEARHRLDQDVRPMQPVADHHLSSPHANPQNWYQSSARNSQVHLPTERQPPVAYTAAPSNALSPAPLDSKAKKRSREPLGMNPPTPPLPLEREYQDENIEIYSYANDDDNRRSYEETPRQALHNVHENVQSTPQHPSSRPSSFVGSGTKSRFYGTLRNSIGSIGSMRNHDEHKKNDDAHTVSDYSEDSENMVVYDVDSSDDEGVHDTQHTLSTERQGWNGQRQTSNSTGYDLHAAYAGLHAEFGRGTGQRREVSGKVVEEGRGGEVAPEKTGRAGAAGWARFRGM